MKKVTKIILGVIIGVLFAYSAFMTLGVYVISQDYNKLSVGNHIAAKAAENKSEYHEMMGIAYSVASAIESGRYDKEQIDEIIEFKAENRGYDETAFRECVNSILEAE